MFIQAPSDLVQEATNVGYGHGRVTAYSRDRSVDAMNTSSHR